MRKRTFSERLSVSIKSCYIIICCLFLLINESITSSPISHNSRGESSISPSGSSKQYISQQHDSSQLQQIDEIENYPFQKSTEKFSPDQVAGLRITGNSLILLGYNNQFYEEQLKEDETFSEIDFFKKYPKLLSVELNKYNVTDDVLENLQTFLPSNLHMLIFDSCKFSENGPSLLADVIDKHTTLKSIRIRMYNSTEEQSEKIIAALKNLSHLVYLGIGFGSISHESMEELASVIENSKDSLKDISLSWEKNLSEDGHGYEKLSEALRQIPNLKNIELAFMSVSENDTKSIFESMKNLKKLTSLNLFIGNLDTHSKVKLFESAEAFGESLKNMKDLTKLDVSNMHLRKEFMHVLASALEKTKNLKILNISGNKVDAECASILSESLKEIVNLETFIANGCSIDSQALSELNKYFTSCFLAHIYLGNNKIKEGIGSFPISNMKDLQFLDLSNNNLGFDDVLTLAKESNSERLQAINFRWNSEIESMTQAERQAKRDQLEELKLKNSLKVAFFGI